MCHTLPVTDPGRNHFISQQPAISKACKHFEIHPLSWWVQNRSFEEDSPKKLDTFEIFYLENGKGELIADINHHFIDGKKMFCLFPGQQRSIKLSADCEGYFIAASTDFILLTEPKADFLFSRQQYSGEMETIELLLDEELEDELEDVLYRLQKEYQNYFLLRWEILIGLFKLFSIYLSRKCTIVKTKPPYKREQLLVRNFMILLKQNYADKKMVSEYAEVLCITPSYLNQVVKRVTGNSASYHIQQQIVLEAKRLARYTTQSMKEIAYNLGFDDIAHFSKFFKMNSGVNFTNFKKEMSL